MKAFKKVSHSFFGRRLHGYVYDLRIIARKSKMTYRYRNFSTRKLLYHLGYDKKTKVFKGNQIKGIVGEVLLCDEEEKERAECGGGRERNVQTHTLTMVEDIKSVRSKQEHQQRKKNISSLFKESV